LNVKVFPFPPRGSDFASGQAKGVLEYLRRNGAKTCVLESEYIDKDYLIDYQEFYSRSFSKEGRYTKRVHFFTSRFSERTFSRWVGGGEPADLQSKYLGFVVVKPVRNSQKHLLIGRSVLRYPLEASDPGCKFVSDSTNVSLFGIPLRVEGLPFQAQDEAVSACATIALWTTMQPLTKTFDVPKHSPAEITLISGDYPSTGRIFPSAGLNIPQMISYVRSVGLDVEFIGDLTDSDDPVPMNTQIIAKATKAYVSAHIPLIASLRVVSNRVPDYHAATIVGYHCDGRGEVDSLYVHDDQIGPYELTLPISGELGRWSNGWAAHHCQVYLEQLLIPVYTKIRLDFHSVMPHVGRLMEFLKRQFELEEDLDYEVFLTTVQEYKKDIRKESIVRKVQLLETLLPRFIWVVRIFESGRRDVDFLIDGTSTKFTIPAIALYQ